MENKHTPTAEKWFLNLSERNGDDYMELTLSEKYGGCSDEMGSKDYMRISGFCSKGRALLIHAAPDMLEALKYARERLKDFDPTPDAFVESAIKKAQPHE